VSAVFFCDSSRFVQQLQNRLPGLVELTIRIIAFGGPRKWNRPLVENPFGLYDMRGNIHQWVVDKTHLHFGAGQTEARLELPPGKHTLQLALGDAKPNLFKPPIISKEINITVK
jgi:hypothetical protein